MFDESTNEKNRKELIKLIKTLTAESIPVVKTFVEFVKTNERKKLLEEFLAGFPEEKISKKEQKILKRRSKRAQKELKEGKLIPFEEVMKKYGKH